MIDLTKNTTREYIFIRKEGFYFVEIPAHIDIAENAKENPGTLEVIDAITKKTVWKAEAAQ